MPFLNEPTSPTPAHGNVTSGGSGGWGAGLQGLGFRI